MVHGLRWDQDIDDYDPADDEPARPRDDDDELDDQWED